MHGEIRGKTCHLQTKKSKIVWYKRLFNVPSLAQKSVTATMSVWLANWAFPTNGIIPPKENFFLYLSTLSTKFTCRMADTRSVFWAFHINPITFRKYYH